MTHAIVNAHRRRLLQCAAVSAAALTLPGWSLAAEALDAADPPLRRPIPSSGELVPIIGLGTNAYGVQSDEEKAPLREVLRLLAQTGNRIVDTAPAYRNSESVLGELIEELGIRKRLFIATKVTAPEGNVAAGIEQLEASFRHLRTDVIDMIKVHNLVGADAILPTLAKWKAQGRVRYIGITTSSNAQHEETAALLRRHDLDVVQVNYSVDDRTAETTVFPTARERGAAVLLNMPMGGRRGSLFGRVRDVALPDFAADFGAETWAQLFLKYAVSHPAVTAALPGTTKADNLIDNLRAGHAPLPSDAQRKQIEAYWDALAA